MLFLPDQFQKFAWIFQNSQTPRVCPFPSPNSTHIESALLSVGLIAQSILRSQTFDRFFISFREKKQALTVISPDIFPYFKNITNLGDREEKNVDWVKNGLGVLFRLSLDLILSTYGVIMPNFSSIRWNGWAPEPRGRLSAVGWWQSHF